MDRTVLITILKKKRKNSRDRIDKKEGGKDQDHNPHSKEIYASMEINVYVDIVNSYTPVTEERSEIGKKRLDLDNKEKKETGKIN